MELRKMENSKNNSSYRVQNSLEERTILSPMTDRLDSSRTSMQQRKQSSKLNYDRLPIIISNDGNSINNDKKITKILFNSILYYLCLYIPFSLIT